MRPYWLLFFWSLLSSQSWSFTDLNFQHVELMPSLFNLASKYYTYSNNYPGLVDFNNTSREMINGVYHTSGYAQTVFPEQPHCTRQCPHTNDNNSQADSSAIKSFFEHSVANIKQRFSSLTLRKSEDKDDDGSPGGKSPTLLCKVCGKQYVQKPGEVCEYCRDTQPGTSKLAEAQICCLCYQPATHKIDSVWFCNTCAIDPQNNFNNDSNRQQCAVCWENCEDLCLVQCTHKIKVCIDCASKSQGQYHCLVCGSQRILSPEEPGLFEKNNEPIATNQIVLEDRIIGVNDLINAINSNDLTGLDSLTGLVKSNNWWFMNANLNTWLVNDEVTGYEFIRTASPWIVDKFLSRGVYILSKTANIHYTKDDIRDYIIENNFISLRWILINAIVDHIKAMPRNTH